MTGNYPLLHKVSAFISIFLLFSLLSCSDQSDDEISDYDIDSLDCLKCHNIELDPSHQFDCLVCHREADSDFVFPENHKNIVAYPAHPKWAAELCGGCHQRESEMVLKNNHYRLSGHIDTVLQAFAPSLDKLEALPQTRVSSHAAPENPQQLTEDLLSRRCLRCHVYYAGDDFSSVAHGTGCAACHLAFQDGRLASHNFTAKPEDDRCLSCHYGNHVGYDYYGRYEHDYNEEYRTPYLLDQEKTKAFGVEYHQLEADVHQRAGMSCIDCHRLDNIMGSAANPTCEQCHDYRSGGNTEFSALTLESSNVVFKSGAGDREYIVPQIENPVHAQYGARFSCQACHAQWTFNDSPTHLLRIDHDDFYDFYKLSLDGSSEVLKIIFSHITEDGDLLEPEMTDKFTGQSFPGIWYKGFGERRWEQVLLAENEEAVVTTVRPILDLHLSWIDAEEELRFDNVEPLPGENRLLPYAPHTIGKAGMFYENRIRPFLDETVKSE